METSTSVAHRVYPKYGQYHFNLCRDGKETVVHCDVDYICPPDPNTGCYGYYVEIGDTWDENGVLFPLTPDEQVQAEREAAEAMDKK